MIGYATLGTNDIGKAQAFYDDLFGSIGAKRIMEFAEPNGFTMYGVAFDKPAIAVTKPYNGDAATIGNGNMVAIPFERRDQVDAFYSRAMALGGSCEGAPGLRGDEGPQAFYGAYFRDLDGNKLCAFRVGPA
jgi:catechol 2,3-dioxygenase-like lactoylglutathione lyase family enzyme